MSVSYNGKLLIPAPFLNIDEEFIKNEQQEIIGSQFNITLTGKLMGWKGSPNSSGGFWITTGYPPDENIAQTSRLTSMITKQKALENLFGTQGLTFQVTGLDGQIILTCNPQTSKVAFSEGIWTEYCDYTVVLQTNQINGVTAAGGLNLRSASENWQIELAEPENDISTQSFRVTHNISAQGLLIYNSDGSFAQPYVWAQNWVLPRLGMNLALAKGSGVTNLPSYLSGWNQVRSENLNVTNGEFSVTETWLMASGNAIEDFTINTKTSIELGITQVGIQGTIQGLETRDSNYQITTTKYQAASGKYESIKNNIFGRAQSYSNTSLNSLAVVTDIGRNPVAGVINYSFEYDSRPTNYVSGVRSEIITIVDSLPNDFFANIPVLGRGVNGPVLQDLSCTTEKSRQLTIELVVQASGLGSNTTSLANAFNSNPRVTAPYSQGVTDIISAATPSTAVSQIFRTGNQESWDPKTGRYSYTTTYTFT